MPVTVPYQILKESEKAKYNQALTAITADEAVWFYSCAYSQVDQFCAELVGRPIAGGAWNIPHRDPKRPWLYCAEASLEGVGELTSTGSAVPPLPNYPLARVVAVYRPLPFINPDDPPPFQDQVFITQHVTSSNEEFTLNERWFFWDDDEIDPDTMEKYNAEDGQPLKPEESRPTVRVPVQNIQVIIHFWQDPPDTLDDLAGTVNEEDFRFLWKTYAADTLLYEGSDRQREITTTTVEAWQISMQFMYRPKVGWQKKLYVPRVDGPSVTFKSPRWSPIYPRPFERADFTELFPS